MNKEIEQLDKPKNKYNPSIKDMQLVRRIYEEFELMRDVTNKPYHYFNDRTLTQFVDDSEKRFNSYVPSRKSQSKEKWQANFFHPVTRNKTMAILASVALDVPPMRITAVNEKNETNMKVAGVVSDLVKASYDNQNKEEENFYETLDAAIKGTVIDYDGYLKTKVTRKEVTSFDVVTGEVEFEEKKITIDKGCKSFIVPLENFFVYSAYVRDIQDQPAVIWVQYMSKRDFAYEFSNYPNYKHVRTGNELVEKDMDERYFFEDWNVRTKERPIEVIRYFNKISDENVIVANGINMLDAPMMLGKEEKYYPFSKGGYAPFSGDFFWMNSLPNALMGEQDIINSFYNMTADKTYKSLVTNLLIGNINKDDFDLEDEMITLDTKVYVQDINQVKEMPNSGTTQSEFNMIKLISQGLDLSSVDSAQQGVQGTGVTAREVVIANEKARELKGIFFLFITGFWMQKIKLRALNILTYYPPSRINAVVGKEKGEQFRKFLVENVDLANGQKGTRGIIIAKDKESLPVQSDIDKNVTEFKAVNPDVNYEEIAVTAEYLKGWEYKIKIVSEDMYQKNGSYSVSKNEDKLRTLGTAFPEFFQKNEEKLIRDTIVSFNEDVDDYDLSSDQAEQEALPADAAPGGAQLEAPVEGQESEEQSQLNLPVAPTQ